MRVGSVDETVPTSYGIQNVNDTVPRSSRGESRVPQRMNWGPDAKLIVHGAALFSAFSTSRFGRSRALSDSLNSRNPTAVTNLAKESSMYAASVLRRRQ